MLNNVFRKFLEVMKESGQYEVVDQEINSKYQIGRILEKFDNQKLVEFRSVTDSKYPVLGNICTSREALALSMGIERSELHQQLLDALQSPIKPQIVDDAPFLRNVDNSPDLNKHGVPKFFKEDTGNYYTSGLVITKGLDSGIHNSSIHNIRVAESLDQDLPIAIAFGMHPAVILAASTPTAISLDEMDVANALLGGELERVALPESGILVPTHAEIVYEGVVLKNQKAKEGPFVDVTGTLDKIRDEPVFRIDRVYYRDNAFMTTILPSRTEHYILMGLGREAKIRESVRNVVPTVGEVYLSTGGGGWLHAIVAIEKQSEGDAKNAIFAAFAAHGSLKWVTVVDLDIDIYNPINVEWATITRTGENDIIIVNKARGSSLDPAMDDETKTSIKVGIDATMSLYKGKESYRKIEIPEDDD